MIAPFQDLSADRKKRNGVNLHKKQQFEKLTEVMITILVVYIHFENAEKVVTLIPIKIIAKIVFLIRVQ